MCAPCLQIGHIAEDSWGAWGELAWAVRTGDSAFKKAHDGKTLWEHLKVHMLCSMLRPPLLLASTPCTQNGIQTESEKFWRCAACVVQFK